MVATDYPERGRGRARIAFMAGIVAIGAIPLVAILRRLDLWSPVFPVPQLLAFVVTFIAMLLAIILGLIGILTRGHRSWSAYPVQRSLFGLILGLIVLVPVGGFLATGMKYPPIHDITTDTANPPKFVALQAERDVMHAPNKTDYDPAVAELQKKAFPDLAPKVLALPASEAFNRALNAAKAMGWRIVAVKPSEGRIEATDTTFWSGFIDDVVIRVMPEGDKRSRIDARSESRVGGGDAGANGLRIRKYLAKLS
jgi:uncharacterized protein (DUF1499 family)